jgi:hypothetical protein
LYLFGSVFDLAVVLFSEPDQFRLLVCILVRACGLVLLELIVAARVFFAWYCPDCGNLGRRGHKFGAMITLGWNCQGMKTSPTVRALMDVHRQIKSDVMFLSESHLDNAKAEKLMRKLKFDKCFVHESDGEVEA